MKFAVFSVFVALTFFVHFLPVRKVKRFSASNGILMVAFIEQTLQELSKDLVTKRETTTMYAL